LDKNEKYIDEPLDEYRSIYKDLHNQNSTEFIDKLIKESGVNLEENQETVKEIRTNEEKREKIKKQISTQSFLKVFLIILVIVSLIVGGYLIYNLITIAFVTTNLLIAIGCILLAAGLIVLLVLKINPKLKQLKKLKADFDLLIKELYEKAWQQMRPLNELFYDGMSAEIFEKTIPLINFDPVFDSKRLDYLINRFGMHNQENKNRSTLYVKSGQINGNPFFICDDLVHNMGTKTYSNSITIHWTTTSTGPNGKRYTNHHSQTLTASVTKPFPLYAEQPYLVYGNDAAPDLIFTRFDSDAENMTERQIDRKVNKEIKKLDKKAEKSVTKGENYTVLGNSEFEVLFGATNRNNEVQFRLLFTPLAQKQLLKIMKETELGYGDDFDFVKNKKINRIYPEHLQKFELNISPSYFYGYELENIRKKFIDYNNDYMRNVYFAFAPILSIPLYQHTLPHEYIYKDLYESYASFYEHEKVVNRMNEEDFKHPLSVTRNILKTKTIKSADNHDQIKVTAYGYQGEERVDYIKKWGGDGKMHTIPVRWIEYLPVEKETDVDIAVTPEEKELTYNERFRKYFEGLRDGSVDKEDVFKVGLLMAYVMKDKK
jgi:hypothetical protein